MNVYARNLERGKSRKLNRPESGMAFALVLRFLFFAAMVFMIVNLRLSYSEKAEKLNRESNAIKSKTHQLCREIEYLKIKKEQLSRWSNINRKIKKFHLALRPPKPNQVRMLSDSPGVTPARHLSGNNRALAASESRER
jgi:hypothetical protein